MYQDLKQAYWWTRMKREIAQFVNECDVCRRVKAEHQRPAGLLQPLAIPEWKFDHIEIFLIILMSKLYVKYFDKIGCYQSGGIFLRLQHLRSILHA